MGSGRIAIIDIDGKIHASTIFNGKMSPKGVGNHIVQKLDESVCNPKTFEEFLWSFNTFYYNPNNDVIDEIIIGDWYNTRYDYANKWNCDYVYIKNLSFNTKCFVTPNGFVSLPPDEVLTLHLGKTLNKFDTIEERDVVTVADIDWIVLKKNFDSVFCLSKDIIDTIRFDINSADYSKSEIRTYLQDLSIKIKNKVGENAFIPRCIDLKVYSDMPPYNIRFNYGMVLDDVGLLTENEYKENQSIINKYQINDSWWLATTHSSWRDGVRCVDNDGEFHSIVYDYKSGVRPACIFSAEAFN